MSAPPIIQIDGLTKVFFAEGNRVEAVKNLTLDIAPGQVYGFLGPNGAGKTTTIRMLVTLIHPTSGTAKILGEDVRKNHAVLRHVGAMVEDATFYKFLTARKNLEVLARTGGYYNARKIEDLLEQVHLSARADDRVKTYSTGMKQRLGIAAALLNDPELVILDEPTNGLDPAGIQEVRHFIRKLADEQGKTIFLSSHLLSEVEQVCDRVAIINKGAIVREGRVDELLSDHVELHLEVSPADTALQFLQEHWQAEKISDSVVSVSASRTDSPAIVRALVDRQIDVFQVSIRRQSLEEYFLDATNQDSAQAHHG